MVQWKCQKSLLLHHYPASPTSNDIAIFTDKHGIVKHMAFYAGKSRELMFLSNNVTTGGKPIEPPGYYTLSQLYKLDPKLSETAIQYFTRQ
jgi:hypothetical protein